MADGMRQWLLVVGVAITGCSAVDDSMATVTTPLTVSEGAAQLQRDILADEWVSEGEMRAAMQASVNCMEARGLDAAFKENEMSTYQTTAGDPTGTMTDGEVTAIIDECGATFTGDVGVAYGAQLGGGVSAPEQARGCLVDAGLVSATASVEEVEAVFDAHLEVGIQCVIDARGNGGTATAG